MLSIGRSGGPLSTERSGTSSARPHGTASAIRAPALAHAAPMSGKARKPRSAPHQARFSSVGSREARVQSEYAKYASTAVSRPGANARRSRMCSKSPVYPYLVCDYHQGDLSDALRMYILFVGSQVAKTQSFTLRREKGGPGKSLSASSKASHMSRSWHPMSASF